MFAVANRACQLTYLDDGKLYSQGIMINIISSKWYLTLEMIAFTGNVKAIFYF